MPNYSHKVENESHVTFCGFSPFVLPIKESEDELRNLITVLPSEMRGVIGAGTISYKLSPKVDNGKLTPVGDWSSVGI